MLFIIVASFIVLCIITLIKDSDLINSCDGTVVWVYLLSSTIVTTFILTYYTCKVWHDEVEELNKYDAMILFTIICFLLWGAVEVHEVRANECDVLMKSLLWDMTNAMYIVSIIVVSGVAVLTCCFNC